MNPINGVRVVTRELQAPTTCYWIVAVYFTVPFHQSEAEMLNRIGWADRSTDRRAAIRLELTMRRDRWS
jgi:hypothetical protein